MSGTVNISRSIWTDAAFKCEPFTEREAFVWIIMEASYRPREKRIGNITVSLERGQLGTSVRFMAEAWGWSKSRVDRFIKRLEKRDMIGTDNGTGINVITVNKYNDYQNVPEGSGIPKNKNRDSSGTAAGQQRDKPNKGLIPDEIQNKEDTNVSLSSSMPDDVQIAFDEFNEVAEKVGWPVAKILSKKRKVSLKARLSEAGGIDGWRIALEKARASPLCTGDNQRGWTADLDFLLQQSSFTKLMEGSYDSRKPNHNTNSHAGIGSGTARAAAAVAERRINGQGNGGGADW